MVKKINCLQCGSSEHLTMYQKEDDWFLDERGYMKRKPSIKRGFSCGMCGNDFELSFKSSVFETGYKEGFIFEVDLYEWNVEVAIHPKTGKKWAGKTNGHNWAIVRIFKNNSNMFFASAFGVIAETLTNDEPLEEVLGTSILTCQLGHNKEKRIVNGKQVTKWKQAILINDEYNGLK